MDDTSCKLTNSIASAWVCGLAKDQGQSSLLSTMCCALQEEQAARALEFLEKPCKVSDKDLAEAVSNDDSL